MKKKILAMFSVAMLAVGMFSTSALASDFDLWDVNYTTGAPSGSANPVDYLYVKSPTGNFNASCTHIEGSKTPVTADSVGFKVVISGPGSCSSNGYILGL